ncbi:hypothetical protein DOTSEDRAFT_80610 [Dothistroma septosporum NZE10]|uniref:Filamentation protein-like protein n=1 Tax=Dothistroma septosporum (strain NZE10 / CBS 128990) TaxID=675120 RepID=M2YMF0_DOTSN|nr:hypothetical protein DOTSEDRAFT_80610 [Dothistroma septosporum NZE10]
MSVHKTPNPEKGARYIGLLDAALCNGTWSEIPELARKVEKHAPDRKCLTLAARAEAQVANASHRPTSASSATSTSIHGLGELAPRLAEVTTTAGRSHPDDAFVASTCLAVIHWLREAPTDALKALAYISQSTAVSTAKDTPGPFGWLEVCQVKNSFVKASCLDSRGQYTEAREIYRSAVSRTPGYRTPELRRWTERLLARSCMHSVTKSPTQSPQDLGEAYLAFKSWGDFWQRASTAPPSSNTPLDIPRRQVWKAYYDLLSMVLQQGLVHAPDAKAALLPAGALLMDSRVPAKCRQRDEMRRVESSYETLLIGETQFPKASQTNQEVEEWTEAAMSNWKVFCGSTWTDAELGIGGKRAVSRNTLDILYRAAMKTFHSTPILRQLFTVHAALGEFDLAMHAFDSYMEIVDKGKARAEKTGKHEVGFDNDDTAMLTAAEAVRILCRYGDREQAEKANEIAQSMDKWLQQRRPNSAQATQTNGDQEFPRPTSQPTSSLLSPKTLGATYRAVGVSQAHWAHLTYESETRKSLLAEAHTNLRRAQKANPRDIETAHALALVLAELRDVPEALDVLRETIENKDDVEENLSSAALIDREKQLLPLWHLLALCLTAEDEFEAAARMCEAAFKQFGDAEKLFGAGSRSTLEVSGRRDGSTGTGQGIVDFMEGFEKETMVQIKMTQIMLFELMEGAEEAADLTDELLSLYSRLFGNPTRVAAEIVAKPPPTAASHAPSRFGGTLRSITGSIRPRSTRSRRGSAAGDTGRQQSIASDQDNLAVPARNRAATTNGEPDGPPIAITVTNENGVADEKPHHRHHLPHLPFQGRGHRSGSTQSKSPGRSMPEDHQNEVMDEKHDPLPAQAAVSNHQQPDQPLGRIAHNASPDDLPAPPGHDDQPPKQDVRLPTAHPALSSGFAEPQMTPIHERRHKVNVLVEAWLFSAELYMRADNFDDAENLINDARRLTESLELELANSEEGINARRLYHKGWGSSKSIDNLWAEVWSTQAHLAQIREQPYDAVNAYEQALAHFPDHAASIIGLSGLLMDIYEEKLPAEAPPTPLHTSLPSTYGSLIAEAKPPLTRPNSSSTLPSGQNSIVTEPEPIETKTHKIDPAPAELNRLAARDRAYMLLSDITKQGAGWDNSEAWLTLARAHELSREIGKAKQALWWVVELENTRPIRPWRTVTPGGYTL